MSEEGTRDDEDELEAGGPEDEASPDDVEGSEDDADSDDVGDSEDDADSDDVGDSEDDAGSDDAAGSDSDGSTTTTSLDPATDADDATPGDRLAALFEPIDDRLHRIDWYPIVTKEFADTIRSRALVGFTVALLALYVMPVLIALYTDLGPQVNGFSALLIAGQLDIMSIVAPLAGIAFGFAAVSGERERGSIKLLLAQPYERRDVLLGKLFGRFGAVTVPLFAVMVLQFLVVLPSDIVQIDLRTWLVFLGLSLCLALVFVGLAVGASAATRTTRRSLVVAGGLWAYLFLLWDSVSQGVPNLWNDLFGLGAGTQIEVELFMQLINPAEAFQTLVTSFTGATQVEARASMFGGLLGGRQSLFRQQEAIAQLGESAPWYLSDPLAVASLVVWLAVPLLLGYWYFREADL